MILSSPNILDILIMLIHSLLLQFYKKTGYDDMQYGIGRCNTSWCSVHRDIQTDFKKFLPHDKSFKTIKESLIIIKQLEVRGEGLLDNIAISQKCHKGGWEK